VLLHTATWLSFFDESESSSECCQFSFILISAIGTVDAIIFLAPISCFDETLAEDPRTNRLVRLRSHRRFRLYLKYSIGGFINALAFPMPVTFTCPSAAGFVFEQGMISEFYHLALQIF